MQTLIPNINDLKVITAKQPHSVERVLSLLEKIEQKRSVQFGKQREFSRTIFRGDLKISLQFSIEDVQDICDVETTSVQGLSISQSGASFLFPGDINYQEILIGLAVQQDKMTWFRSKIVRKQSIPNVDYWEYGAMFVKKLNE